MAGAFASQSRTGVTSADEMRSRSEPWKDGRRWQSPSAEVPPGSEGEPRRVPEGCGLEPTGQPALTSSGTTWGEVRTRGPGTGVLARRGSDPGNEDTGRRWPQEKPALWTP